MMNPFDGSTGVHLGFADPTAKASAFGPQSIAPQGVTPTPSKAAQQQSAAQASATQERDLPSREQVATGIIKQGTLVNEWGNWMLASHFIDQLAKSLSFNEQKHAEAQAWLGAADQWLGANIGGSATIGGKTVEVKYPIRAAFQVFLPRIDAQVAAVDAEFGKAFSNYVSKPTVGWKLAVFQPSVVPSLVEPFDKTVTVWNYKGYVTNVDAPGSFQQAKTETIGSPGQNHGPKYGGPDPKCCAVAANVADAKSYLDTVVKYRDQILALKPSTGVASKNFDGTWMGKNFVELPWYWVYTQVKDYTGLPWKTLHDSLKGELDKAVAARKALFAPFMAQLTKLFSASGIPVAVAVPWVAAGAKLERFTVDGKEYDATSAQWEFVRSARELAAKVMQQAISSPELSKAWNSSKTAVSDAETMLAQAAHIETASAKYAEDKAKLEQYTGTLSDTSDLSSATALQEAAAKAKKDVEYFVGHVSNLSEALKERCDKVSATVSVYSGMDLDAKEKGWLSEIGSNLKVCEAALSKIGKILQQSLVTIDSQLPKIGELQQQITDSTGETPPTTGGGDGDGDGGGGGGGDGGGGGGVIAVLAAAAALLLLRS